MSQQAQDDYYKDEVALAMDYAAAVNVEIEDLFVAGADIVQVDEPYMQARPEKAKRFGVQVLDRALARHRRHHGDAHLLRLRRRHPQPAAGYSFLPELEASKVRQISIETAQAKLDCSVLEKLPSKTILLGVLDLSDMSGRDAGDGRRPHPPRPAARAARAHRRGARLRPQVPAARGGLRQDAGDGNGRRHRAPRAGSRAVATPQRMASAPLAC